MSEDIEEVGERFWVGSIELCMLPRLSSVVFSSM